MKNWDYPLIAYENESFFGLNTLIMVLVLIFFIHYFFMIMFQMPVEIFWGYIFVPTVANKMSASWKFFWWFLFSASKIVVKIQVFKYGF